MNVDPTEVALTDSTTMGTSLLFNGMKLKPGDEILATTHDHYVTDKSIDYACEKTGATVKRIDEYKDPFTITVEEVVHNISNAITDKTRVLMVTWVQSCTGVKLPIKAISEVVKRANTSRSAESRIYFAVDGVHGFGNQDEDISSLGCDFFSAGTHKWIFGPRGTGILYGKKDAWDFVRPTIPPFSWNPFMMWMGSPQEGELTFADLMTPGGFHAFDHRWALNSAFDFQMEMGRKNVHRRTTELNTMLKEGIHQMKRVRLITPLDPVLSAGINCFLVDKLDADQTVSEFHKLGVIASSSPYLISYARLTPCVINTEEEVEQSLSKLEEIAGNA
jgi:selenocysteine lyase/cysteine desulfurase